MSQNKLQMQGLTELRKALLDLPEDLAMQAGDIVRQHASVVAEVVGRNYPIGPTGNLKRGVTVEHNSSKFSTSSIVRSRARHAQLYEMGVRGRAPRKPPEGRQMIPVVVRMRARMVESLINFMRAYGFQVSE